MNHAYSYRKRSNSNEWHIFEGNFTSAGGCNPMQLSLCGRVNQVDYRDEWVSGAICISHDEALHAAGMLGSGVCSTCLRELSLARDHFVSRNYHL